MKILFLSHDASRTGAPIVLLNLLNWLKKIDTNIEIQVLLRRGGALEKAFHRFDEIYYWQFKQEFWNQLARGVKKLFGFIDLLAWRQNIITWKLRRQSFDLVYGNTVLAADVLDITKLLCPKILHIHELEYVAKYYGDFGVLEKVLPKLDKVIAVSEAVKIFVEQQFEVPSNKVEIVYPFSEISNLNRTKNTIPSDCPKNTFLVGGCGTIDWRKGTDLFIQVAQKIIAALPKEEIHFLWLGGDLEQKGYFQIKQDLQKLDLVDRVHFVGSQPNAQDYFERFDLFLMTSREDPFPLVCLENAQMGNPIICFEGATGSEIYIDNTTGKVVSYMDMQAMAAAVLHYYQNRDLLEAAGEKIKKAVSNYTIENSGNQIWSILEELTSKKV